MHKMAQIWSQFYSERHCGSINPIKAKNWQIKFDKKRVYFVYIMRYGYLYLFCIVRQYIIVTIQKMFIQKEYNEVVLGIIDEYFNDKLAV